MKYQLKYDSALSIVYLAVYVLKDLLAGLVTSGSTTQQPQRCTYLQFNQAGYLQFPQNTATNLPSMAYRLIRPQEQLQVLLMNFETNNSARTWQMHQ